jgi:cell division protein FtsB
MPRLQRLVRGNRTYVAALLALVVLLGVMFLGPLESLSVASGRVEDLEQEQARLEEEVAALEQRRAALQEPEEIELLAREELGMVRPGETPYVVVPAEPAPSPSGEEAEAAGDRSWFGDVWHALTGVFD